MQEKAENETKRHIRLFAALPVPPAFAEILASLPRAGVEGRWSGKNDLHITLRFLGDIPEDALPAIHAALRKIKRPRFFVEAEGLGHFALKRQTVLWAGVQSTRKMTALAGDINEALSPLGFEMPRKPYIPHITLARLQTPRGVEHYIERHGKRISARWEADSFSLYQSATPAGEEDRYAVLEEYPLLQGAH